MKNAVLFLFFWILVLIAINTLQNDTTKKRVSELVKDVANYDYEIFRLK